jgi:hypothetical protein
VRFSAALILASLLAAQTRKFEPGPPVPQPLPYSHKKHLSLGLKCDECHRNEDPGERMGIPPTSTCMACHKTVASSRPAIQQLAKHHEERRDVPWERVYRIPGYVFFSHRAHLEAKATCADCHGEVARRDVLFLEKDVSMGACMNCHYERRAPNHCQFCHENR